MTINNILSVLFIACVILIGVGVYKEARAAQANNLQRTDANGRSYKPHVGDTVLYTYRAGVLRMRSCSGTSGGGGHVEKGAAPRSKHRAGRWRGRPG